MTRIETRETILTQAEEQTPVANRILIVGPVHWFASLCFFVFGLIYLFLLKSDYLFISNFFFGSVCAANWVFLSKRTNPVVTVHLFLAIVYLGLVNVVAHIGDSYNPMFFWGLTVPMAAAFLCQTTGLVVWTFLGVLYYPLVYWLKNGPRSEFVIVVNDFQKIVLTGSSYVGILFFLAFAFFNFQRRFREAFQKEHQLKLNLALKAKDLLQKQDELEALVTSLEDMVFIIDRKMTILKVWWRTENFRFAEPDAMLGKNVAEYMSTEFTKRMGEALEKVDTTAKAQILEFNGIHNAGKVFEMKISPIDSQVNHQRLYSVFVRDITESKKLHERVHMSRLAALGEMAGGIAHEINSPLTVILADTRRIRGKIKEIPSPLFEEIQKITYRTDGVVERIAKIVNGLRSFARDGAQDPTEPVEIGKIISDVLDLCGGKFAHGGVRIDAPTGPELSIKVTCRPIQIGQVILNLISNSYDAIQGMQDAWIHFELTDSGDALRVAILDSGEGIPADVAEKMFEPFYTTKQLGKGTGLGLSVSKGIMAQHQGDIFLDQSRKNTCIVLVLPKA